MQPHFVDYNVFYAKVGPVQMQNYILFKLRVVQ